MSEPRCRASSGQAESVGEILGGIGLALVAAQVGVSGAMAVSVALFTTSALLVWFRSPGQHEVEWRCG